MVPHLIVFTERNLVGRHWHIFGDVPNLSTISFNLEDNISSFVVLAGTWQFYRERQFAEPVGQPCVSGIYRSLADTGIPVNAVSSIKLVGD